MGRLVSVLLGFVLVGGPLVLFSWHELSESLLGRPHPVRLVLAIALIPVLLLVLRVLGRYLRHLEGAEHNLEGAEHTSIPGRRV